LAQDGGVPIPSHNPEAASETLNRTVVEVAVVGYYVGGSP
jgi:hypothetical protein